MSRSLTPLILIILAIVLFFSFTRGKIDELKSIQASNLSYSSAIDSSVVLIKKRDAVNADYSKLSDDNKTRLNKILPDNIDNVRLIIDVKDGIAARHGITLRNIQTTVQPTDKGDSGTPAAGSGSSKYRYAPVTISFAFSASYQNFLSFLKDIESSLRILDVNHISVTANSTGTYDYTIELKTYWLKQQ